MCKLISIVSVLAVTAAALSSCSSSGLDRSRIVANPVDLNYSFHAIDTAGYLSSIPFEDLAAMTAGQKDSVLRMLLGAEAESAGAREAADPVVTIYKGKY